MAYESLATTNYTWYIPNTAFILEAGNETLVFVARPPYDDIIYKDFGINYFKNFSLDFKLCVFGDYGGVINDPGGLLGGAYFNNTTQRPYGWLDDDTKTGMGIEIEYKIIPDIKIRLFSCINGDYSDDSSTRARNTDYWLTLTRNNTTLTLDIYDDEARTNLKDTLIGTIDDTFFRYFNPVSCREEELPVTLDGDITGRIGNFAITSGEEYDLPCDFKIIQSSTSVYLSTPNSITFTDSKGIQQFYFWNDSSVVIDIGKESEEITLSGIENKRGRSKSITSVMYDVDKMVENGTSIEIDDLGIDDIINTTWFIKEFSYTVNAGEKDACSWSLTLEKDY